MTSFIMYFKMGDNYDINQGVKTQTENSYKKSVNECKILRKLFEEVVNRNMPPLRHMMNLIMLKNKRINNRGMCC